MISIVDRSLELLQNEYPSLPVDELKAAYKEPHRFYHNTDHIRSIITKIPLFRQAYGLSADITKTLYLVAWYHDVIYVPGASENEARSAERLMEDLDFSEDALAVQTILDTKTHTRPSSWLSAMFLDLDLADLGRTEKIYQLNADNLRKEYLSKFTEEQWIQGRINFLENYNSREELFFTSLGFREWYHQAKFNMLHELLILRSV